MIANAVLDVLSSLPYFRGKGKIVLQILRANPNRILTARLPFDGRIRIGVDTMRQTVIPYWLGKYETAVIRVFNNCLTRLGPQDSVVDIGANTGFYTVLAAAALRAREQNMVHSFEPNPLVFAELQQNIALNQFTNVSAHQQAVGGVISNMTLYVNENAITYSSLRRTQDFLTEQVQVPVTTLDEYARTMPIAKLGLLKMDVEGGELLALKGAAQVLTRDHPTVIYEEYERSYKQFGYSTRDVRQFLSELGYRLFAIPEHGSTPNLQELAVDNTNTENYQNVLATPR